MKVDNDLKEVQAVLRRSERERRALQDVIRRNERAHRDLIARFNRLVDKNASLRRKIDKALDVTPDERQAETGAGIDGAVALLIKRYFEAV